MHNLNLMVTESQFAVVFISAYFMTCIEMNAAHRT